MDVGFAIWSLYDLITEPSWANFGWFALDVASIIIPFATGGSTAVKWIVKGGNGADNLLDLSSVPKRIIKNADDIVVIGQNMERVNDAVLKLGGGIIYGGLDDFAELALKHGDEFAQSIGYADNMAWIVKQAWAGKTFLNIGYDAQRLLKPSLYKNSFRVCKGEILYYYTVMLCKVGMFWSHRIIRFFME